MTTTIKLAFTYEGEKYNLTATLTPDLAQIKQLKKNQGASTDAYDDYWCIAFWPEDTGKKYFVELQLKYDQEEPWRRTTEPEKVLLWNEEVIEDEIDEFHYAYSAVTK